MRQVETFQPVKPICAIMASHEKIFSDSEDALINAWGPLELSSPAINFDYTDYYAKQMGPDLKRKFISFKGLIDPSDLSEMKSLTNNLEEEYRRRHDKQLRLVNLDPGYLRPSALIMATGKDFSHRIPLQNGIFAHLELLFGKDRITALPWTYPDLKAEHYHPFLTAVRKLYLEQLRNLKS
jgi:hypothetical protein